MKYALVIDDVIDTISRQPIEDWEPVPDNVFAGWLRDGDGWTAPPVEQAPPQPITKVSKARIGLYLIAHDDAHGTALWPTLKAVIASSETTQFLWDAVVDVEIDRGGVPEMWQAVRDQTGTELTVQDVFAGAEAVLI